VNENGCPLVSCFLGHGLSEVHKIIGHRITI
jgi:hypothetical protein